MQNDNVILLSGITSFLKSKVGKTLQIIMTPEVVCCFPRIAIREIHSNSSNKIYISVAVISLNESLANVSSYITYKRNRVFSKIEKISIADPNLFDSIVNIVTSYNVAILTKILDLTKLDMIKGANNFYAKTQCNKIETVLSKLR